MIRHKTSAAWTLGAPAAVSLAGLVACRPARPATPPGSPQPPAVTLAPAPAARLHNTLRWKTDEVSNFGYDIFRAESEAGPFVKINNSPVPGTLQHGKAVQTFEYEDDTIDPRKEYWYYVESITLLGERVKFTPTLKAPAKVPSSSP